MSLTRKKRIKSSTWRRGLMAAAASQLPELAGADYKSALSEGNSRLYWSNNSIKDAPTTQ